MNKTFIWVTFQKEGIHCYLDALTNPKLVDVKFLGYEHRHMFHFKVKMEVFHDDREVEFIQCKRWLSGLYTKDKMDLNHRSCEMIATELMEVAKAKYGKHRAITIEVSEDLENGAIVEYGGEQ